MATLANSETRAALIARLERLQPEVVPQWGSMTAPKMLAHCHGALLMTYGDLPCKPKNMPLFRLAPVKWLVLNVFPFPKSAPTAKELLSRVPDSWNDEKAALSTLIHRFENEKDRESWPDHPLFGRMNAKEWGVLAAKHLDHHFRQFGV